MNLWTMGFEVEFIFLFYSNMHGLVHYQLAFSYELFLLISIYFFPDFNYSKISVELKSLVNGLCKHHFELLFSIGQRYFY